MLKHKKIDQVCCIALALTMLLTILFMNGQSLGLAKTASAMGYEGKLFDPGRVHTINIVMDDWDSFLKTCTNEEYSSCSVFIDGEAYKNIAIRAKGNTSLSSVAAYGNNRYSFKLEFNQYDLGKSYHGLDKLSLNNLIQDTTLLKDYLSYSLMNKMGVNAPLCSYVWVTINGQDWGLYLAVEGVEESFLQRNYGKSYGNLYKPDSMSFGGGRGNGADFQFGQFAEGIQDGGDGSQSAIPGSSDSPFQFPGNFAPPDGVFDPSKMPQGDDGPSFGGQMPTMPQTGDSSGAGFVGGGNFPGGFGGIGSDDVKLKYIDESPESYANIFNSAKTKVSEADKKRLIQSLLTLSEGKDIESIVDVNAVICYLAVHNFLCNGDSYTGMMVHNYYLYEKDGVLSMIPWDYNLGFGAFNMGGFGGSGGSGAVSSINAPIDSPVSAESLTERPMIAWIFENEAYIAQYHQVYAKFMEEVFSSGYFEMMLDETLALISPYVKKDPTAFYSYEEFERGSSTLRQFCLKRAQSVTGQLEGTIPSTSQGQSADSSSLIDASGVQISDMGGMSMGGGFPMGGDRMVQNWPGNASVPNSEAPSESQTTEGNTPARDPSSSSVPDTEKTSIPPSSGMPKTGRFSAQSNFGTQGTQATVAPASTSSSEISFPEANAASPTEAPVSPDKNPIDAVGDKSDAKNPAGSWDEFSFGGTREQAAGPVGASKWLLLGASAVVLLVGLFIAAFYKKRW